MTLDANIPSPPSAARLAAEALFLPLPPTATDKAGVPSGVTVVVKRRRLPSEPSSPDQTDDHSPTQLPEQTTAFQVDQSSLVSYPPATDHPLDGSALERGPRVFRIQEHSFEHHAPAAQEDPTASPAPASADDSPPSGLTATTQDAYPRLKRRRRDPNTRPVLIRHIVVQPAATPADVHVPQPVPTERSAPSRRQATRKVQQPTIADLLAQLAALSKELDAIEAMSRVTFVDETSSATYQRFSDAFLALSSSLRPRK